MTDHSRRICEARKFNKLNWDLWLRYFQSVNIVALKI